MIWFELIFFIYEMSFFEYKVSEELFLKSWLMALTCLNSLQNTQKR